MQDKLEQALEQVRSNHDEAVRFAADPEGYLRAKGINTEGMKFGPAKAVLSDGLSEAELEQVAGGALQAPVAGICGSVGCIACITAGD